MEYQITMLGQLHKTYEKETVAMLAKLKEEAIHNRNIFASLMDVTKFASIGQITESMFHVGGQYRRNM